MADSLVKHVTELNSNIDPDIAHGDLKPENILMYDIEGEMVAKVTDFSYSCMGKLAEDFVKLPRSLPWHAPEYLP
jgi:Ser/Thr protein kinase RdoA (MazF antagonist)